MLKGPKLLISTYSATSSLQKQGQNVIDRMKNSGWGMGDDSNKEDEYERGQHSAQDSGYAEDDSYLGGWNKLKKAVWKEGTSESGSTGMSRNMSNTSYTTISTNTVSAGAGLYWNKVVASAVAASSVVSTSVSEAVQRAGTEDDDFTVGPDGDTKLTRAIKEYHISKANSASDLPTWLFPLSERRRETSSSQQHLRPTGSNRSHSYEPERESYNRDQVRGGGGGERQMRPSNQLQHSNTDYDYRSSNSSGSGSMSRSSRRGGEDEYGRGGGEERFSEDSNSRRRENPSSGSRRDQVVIESSGSRTTDKLRAMSAAKRVVRSDY